LADFALEWRAGHQRDEQTESRGTFAPVVFQFGETFLFD